MNLHFHTLVLDGVFTVCAEGGLEFHPSRPPSDAEVARLLSRIRVRILRLLARHGVGPHVDVAPPDPMADESPALAGLSRASVLGRVALGMRAGARLLALGRDPEARWVSSGGPRHAHLDGFDLHANVSVRGDDREGLEQLCRYLLRPAVAQDRPRLTDDGHVVLELKSAWGDGTTHLVFEPLDFLGRLAALTPRPRINLVFYHGVLAPHARSRAAVVSYGRAAPKETAATSASLSLADRAGPGEGPTSRAPRRAWGWAELMRRAFDLDVLACPRCGGRLRLRIDVGAERGRMPFRHARGRDGGFSLDTPPSRAYRPAPLEEPGEAMTGRLSAPSLGRGDDVREWALRQQALYRAYARRRKRR